MSIKNGVCSVRGNWIDFIRSVSGKGFEHVELRVDNVDKDSYIFNRDYLQRVRHIAGEAGLTLSLHSLEGTNLGEKVSRIRNASINIISDVMEAGEYMGALWITAHIGSGGFSNSDTEKKYSRLDCAIKGVEELLHKTEGLTIKLALENLPRYQPIRGLCRLGDCAAEFKYIFEHIHSNRIGMVFDIAHARINVEKKEVVKEFIESVADKIMGFHVHWNDTNIDSHLPLKQECMNELGDYLSTAAHILGQGVPLLCECYQMEENMECLKLIRYMAGGIHMIESFDFEKVESGSLEYLREMQLKELKGQVQDFTEEGIITYKADFVRIVKEGKNVGYTCIGTYEDYKDTILEYYLIPECRRHAGEILRCLAKRYGCKDWVVNTQDFFALPVMLDLGLAYEVSGYIFGADFSKDTEYTFEPGISFEVTGKEELEEVYELIMQDGFYTGGGMETVEPRLAEEQLYSLRLDGRLIGIGFVDVLDRTPRYADIAMIIHRSERGKGLGTALVKALIHESRRRNIIPTALTGVNNKRSRKTLENAGFYLDGCMLTARIE